MLIGTTISELPTTFDELMDTPIDFSAFVMNQLNITNLTQELLVGPTFNLLKGTCKSRTELEYHFKECYKATTDRLDWHNPKGKQYPFDLRGSLSRKYSTSVTKTKAATYEVKWIEDMVPNLWSPIKMVYDKHAYWGTSHWVTSLKIMKWYDYCHLDEIEVRREDQQLYKFKEAEYGESNTYVLERFNTAAGNPVKETLLKLSQPDHRYIYKDGHGVKSSSEGRDQPETEPALNSRVHSRSRGIRLQPRHPTATETPDRSLNTQPHPK
ncbi:hypothetical protein Tco_0799762, partial [Tanacetum coccineum]